MLIPRPPRMRLNLGHLSLMTVLVGLLVAQPLLASDAKASDALDAAINGAKRTESLRARDGARHPREVLMLAELNPNDNVVELLPGGGYWTEILAPYITQGHYRLVLGPSSRATDEQQLMRWQTRLQSLGVNPASVSFGFLDKTRFELGADGSADVVLTFRNIHNWMEDDRLDATLAAIYRSLKPGGRLLVEEHRGRTDRPQDPKAQDGYVREDFMRQAATHAGFTLTRQSEVLANPRDTKDYPEGVWTLPPTLALGDKDRAKYLAIGEADNFLLLFTKPRTATTGMH
jgi:predicted methyltransferase